MAIASLDVFLEEETLAHLPEKIERLAEHLARIGGHPHVGHTRQCGLIGGIELVRDRTTKEPYPWEEKKGLAVCQVARQRGVLARPLGNVLVVMPPLSVNLEELDRICQALEEGIVAVTEA